MKSQTENIRKTNTLSRRSFIQATGQAAALAMLGSRAVLATPVPNGKKLRVGLIGCGSVSGVYMPQLAESPFVEVVSFCDIKPERAKALGKRYKIADTYPNIEEMLTGVPFDFLVDLTNMQEHEKINRRGLEAGKHVWTEKPIANTLAAGQELLKLAISKGIGLWSAPITVQSPQFAFMAKNLAEGKLGRVAAAHAHYGHEGPDWSAFFYEKLGGSLPDLAVYNLTSLTGLLGPVKRVTSILSIVTSERTVKDKGHIKVEEEDNAMVLMDHGQGIISHVQSGFNYLNPNGHDGSKETGHTISIVGSEGFLGLVGYDWDPHGVDFACKSQPEVKRYAVDKEGYDWPLGVNLVAEHLINGRKLLITPEQALHVLDIITAARESNRTGRHIDIKSTFDWPLIEA